MQILRLVKPQLRIKVERRLALERNATTAKQSRDARRPMNRPLATARRTLDCGSPLAESRFFADVDLLTASDEPEDDAPLRNSIGEANELLRLGTHMVT